MFPTLAATTFAATLATHASIPTVETHASIPTVEIAPNVYLPALKELYLDGNKIGDEGMRHLREALARGAAPVLKDLDVSSNPASDAAQQAVKDAIKVK